MKTYKKTAIAMAIAQFALVAGNPALAQSAAAPDAAGKNAEPAVVIVSSQRAALQSAQKIKQDADEIVDSIVADDIGKLPDRSVTEVLQRVVGVTMDRHMQGDPQHYAVEGSGISIRGLTYVRSELNGRDSFSANGGRSLNFEDVPPELMAGVDVYKNPSAEQIEGAVSGLVNLRTALPFDYKGFKGALSAQTSYSKLRKGKAAPSGSLLLSNRWKTGLGEFGALVDLAHSESNTRTDAYQIDPYYPRTDIEPGRTLWVPKGALWRTMHFEREREGKYAAFQWRPNQDLTTSLTYFRSDYHMTWSEQALLMQHTTPFGIQVANGTYDANGALMSGTLSDPKAGGINLNPDRRVADRDSSTTDIAFNTRWRATPQWTLRADVQNIKAKTRGLDSDVATGLQLQKQGLDLTGDLPRLIFDEADRARMADPNNYYWAYTMEHLDKSSARSKALKLDAQYDFDDPVLRDVRFGVRFADRNSHTHNSNPSYNWKGVTQPWMVGWQIPHVAYLGDPRFNNETNIYTFPNFFSGKSSVPAMVFPNDSLARGYPDTYAALHKYHDVLCAEMKSTCEPWAAATFGTDPAEINDVNEKTKSFFTQLRFGFDKFAYPIDGSLGLRYVKTDSTANGYTTFKPALPDIPAGATVSGLAIPALDPIAEKKEYANSYSNVLPSLNLRMKISDKLQFRLAAGKAMSRPDFSQLQGYTTLSQEIKTSTDPVTKAVTINNVSLTGTAMGNPLLRPTTARQFDLTAEYYFAPGNQVTLAVFDKELKDVIVNQMSNYAVVDRSGKTQNFAVSSPVNGAKGYARGFELAYQQYFDKVPAWLKGIGVQGSFTFVDSERKLYNPVAQEYCNGTSDGAQNLNLYINGCDTDGRSFNNLPLQGLSRRTINLAVMYDSGPISARLAYNWRSKHLQAVNTWGARGTDGKDTNPASPTFGATNLAWGLPLWADDYGQLDASFFYKLTEKLSIGIEAQNLNDATSKQLTDQHMGQKGHAWFVTGPRYTAQMRYTF